MNRDLRGGTLDRLARELDVALAGGAERIVLDNTYPTRSSRAPVIAAAHRHGVAIRCRWLDTSIEDAQVNAATRVLDRLGHLPDPDELRRAAKKDPNLFPPTVQFAWRRDFEPPSLDEGWDLVEVVPFERRPSTGTRRGLIVELDAALAAPEQLTRARELGWIVAATAWNPTEEQLRCAGGIEVAACMHPGGPPACWCRKPMPGLGLVLARAHDLDLTASVHVGDGAADRGFASRLGMRFVETAAFVAGHWGAPP
jgi:hypothetical protein